MIQHPAEYPWTSYHHNALDKNIQLITTPPCYNALGKSLREQKEAYKSLFEQDIPDLTIEEIRAATNKAWVLGEDRFKQQIEQTTGRRVSPMPQGGDRKSNSFREKGNQRH
jgi:putative transposase